MKYCSHCGKELLDDAVICVGCGCKVDEKDAKAFTEPSPEGTSILNTLSERLKINGIIWLVIGILQVLGGIYLNWILLIVGVLNIVSSVQDMKYSKTILEQPTGILAKFESITGPIITLVYNLVIGGVIGVAGSIYYFLPIRNYVVQNKEFFASLDTEENKS